MNQFKRAQIIMLSTEDKCFIYMSGDKTWLTSSNVILDDHPVERNQHLYIISDDKIKEGDYFLADNRLNTTSNKGLPNWVLCKCTKVKNSWVYCNEIPDEGHNGDWCKKIIATTDTSLRIYDPCIQCDGTGETVFSGTYITQKKCDLCSQLKYPNTKALSQPSQQFIEKYIKSYNKGEVITDVLVEYEYFSNKGNIYGNPMMMSTPKPTFNIKVNPKDNTITIKKLKDSWNKEEIIKLIKSFANNYQYASNDIGYNKWIEENL